MQRVTVLLSHYWAADEDPAIREAQLGDWLDALSKFAAPVVAEACAEWFRTEPQRRPTIGSIYAICRESVPKPREAMTLPRPADEYRAYHDQRTRQWQEAADEREAWAQEHGCRDFAEAIRIGIGSLANRRLVNFTGAR